MGEIAAKAVVQLLFAIGKSFTVDGLREKLQLLTLRTDCAPRDYRCGKEKGVSGLPVGEHFEFYDAPRGRSAAP